MNRGADILLGLNSLKQRDNFDKTGDCRYASYDEMMEASPDAASYTFLRPGVAPAVPHALGQTGLEGAD